VVKFDAAGVCRISRSPSFAVASFDSLDRSSDVDEDVVTASAEPRPFRRLFSKPLDDKVCAAEQGCRKFNAG
jgi:hypothetical protein